MATASRQHLTKCRAAERGVIRKSAAGRIRVALVYPNSYHVGMSNLGFQTVYRLINEIDHVVCERAFLPEQDGGKTGRALSVESQTPIEDFDIIAFSISYENDAPAVLTILETARLPLPASRRNAALPLVLAGGVFCFLNPEPLAPFVDAFLLGEAEALISEFFRVYDPAAEKQENLLDLARRVSGLYVPAFYQPTYGPDGRLKVFEPIVDVPATVERRMVPDLAGLPTASAILTPDTTFDDTCLIEVSRGCSHGCRFCSAGYVYRPPRYRPVDLLDAQVDDACALTDRIGLVGAAVSDLPGIRELCTKKRGREIRFSFSTSGPSRASARRWKPLKKATSRRLPSPPMPAASACEKWSTRASPPITSLPLPIHSSAPASPT